MSGTWASECLLVTFNEELPIRVKTARSRERLANEPQMAGCRPFRAEKGATIYSHQERTMGQKFGNETLLYLSRKTDPSRLSVFILVITHRLSDATINRDSIGHLNRNQLGN